MQKESGQFFPSEERRRELPQNDPGIIQETSILLFPPFTKRQIVKNLFVLIIGSFLFFWGFGALSNLQSSMNSKQGVGTTSLATMYAASMVSALLLPQLMIKSIGCKMTYVLSLSCGVPYLVANYWSTWETLVPTSFLIGLALGCAITTTSTYIHEMTRRYGLLAGADDSESIAATFYGVFSFNAANTVIWGSLVSYGVLRPGSAQAQNTSAPVGGCGVNFVNRSKGTNSGFEKPTDGQHDLLVSIFVASGVLSVLTVLIFLDPLDNDRKPPRDCKSVLGSLAAAGKQASKFDQLLLVIISIYCGLEVAFYTSEYTEAFIACSLGVYYVGFVSVCFGVCSALMSVLVGPLVKMTSQTSVILLAAFIHLVTYGLLFSWQPSTDAPTLCFVFAGLLGVADAIWWSQITALYGLMFPNNREAAFSNFFLWAFFGHVIDFSCSYYLSVAVKLQILITFLVVGVVLYIIGQIKVNCTKRTGYIDDLNGD